MASRVRLEPGEIDWLAFRLKGLNKLRNLSGRPVLSLRPAAVTGIALEDEQLV